MPKFPREPRPDNKPARPPAPETFVSYESDLRFIKKGGRIYVVEVITRISELKRTDNNLIEFSAKLAKAMINGEAKQSRSSIKKSLSDDDTMNS